MEKDVIVTVIGQEMVERRTVRSFSAIFVVLYIAHIVPTCLRLLHMHRQFAQHLLSHGNLRAAGVCRLFVCP